MNYIQQLNEFDRWLEANTLPAASQLLYYRLLAISNRCGWPEWIAVDVNRLMTITGVSKNTALAARDNLASAGFINIRKGKKGSPSKIKILCKYYTENETVSCTVSCTENETVSCTHNKTKLNKTNISSVDDITKRARFIPPSVGQIKAYCDERGNKVDAQRFFDFYSAKGWMIGKNKVKDWRACVRTWENQKDKTQASYDLDTEKELIGY